MIQIPRRSVTRFFIPMIDVLTVLFCMFLLMPIIRENESLSEASSEVGEMEKRLQELRQDELRARAMLKDLSDRKRGLIQQNVFIRLLYVSPRDGTLWFFDPVDPLKAPLKITNSAVAASLIERHKKEAGERELLYIFQEPHEDNGEVAPYPTALQAARYREWFGAVDYEGCLKPPASKGAK
jgi:hypothetical protein